MKNKFFISDHHLGHLEILNFKNYNGSNVRNFSSLEDMHSRIITNHNKVVNDNDTVYFLGDVVINKNYFYILNELKGKKKLILGNHDIFNIKEYQKYFTEIVSYKVFPEFICSHIPIHQDCVSRFKYNIHGHLHNNTIKYNNNDSIFLELKDDLCYYNVSCERINYTPVEYNELIKILNSSFRLLIEK